MLVRVGIAAAVVGTARAASVSPVASPRNRCGRVPIVTGQRNDLGFRASWPMGGRPGARGHAKVNLQKRTVSGVMCQVNRGGSSILLSIGHRLLFSSHHA